jgi:hypothetical protein
LRVRDIIKFGRVNFKITEIKCDHIDEEFTGTCHSTNLSNFLFQSKFKKKTEEPEKVKNEPIVDAFINEHDISGIGENNGTGMNMLTEENPPRLN